MLHQAYLRLLALMGVLLIVSACGMQPAVVTEVEQPAPPVSPVEPTALPSPTSDGEAVVGEEAAYEPLSAELCTALQEAMAAQLETDIILSTAPFQDYITGGTGTACRLEASGTGQEFPHFLDVAAGLRTMLEGLGWTEQSTYLADGPTGTATAFQNEGNLCLVRVEWQPSAAVQCPADQPISACEVPPEHQIYTIVIECAQVEEAEG